MADLSQPVPTWVILASIGFIIFCIVVGLGLVAYYKNRIK